jgi:L-ascorbate metabolism protein UlaG (beta-lactamase superfamily)
MNNEDIPVILPKSVLKMLKQQVGKHPGRTPVRPLPSVKPNFDTTMDPDSFSVTWLGHSNMLIRINELTILTDPVFSNRASPVSFIGPKPFPVASPLTPEELPIPDVILLSHDHFDHLNYRTIRDYYIKVKHFLVPLGLTSKHLVRWGVSG